MSRQSHYFYSTSLAMTFPMYYIFSMQIQGLHICDTAYFKNLYQFPGLIRILQGWSLICIYWYSHPFRNSYFSTSELGRSLRQFYNWFIRHKTSDIFYALLPLYWILRHKNVLDIYYYKYVIQIIIHTIFLVAPCIRLCPISALGPLVDVDVSGWYRL